MSTIFKVILPTPSLSRRPQAVSSLSGRRGPGRAAASPNPRGPCLLHAPESTLLHSPGSPLLHFRPSQSHSDPQFRSD
eukprot:768131-Hanusia_phi.AAC.6